MQYNILKFTFRLLFFVNSYEIVGKNKGKQNSQALLKLHDDAQRKFIRIGFNFLKAMSVNDK